MSSLTRRSILALSTGFLAVAVADQQEANAILFSGAQGSGGTVGVLTTITLTNTSGSTQATNFLTPMFGLPFVQGQIPSGQAPVFQLTNGTNVPYSISVSTARKTWPDGSLGHAAFILRPPTTVAGSGTLTINVLGGGSFPANSSRSQSDYTAGGLDLNLPGTALDGAAGTWTSNLSQGISTANSDNYKYMDGDCGRVDRIRASNRSAGSDHGYLETYWYLAALQDNSGTLAGIRYLPRLTQPWYNTGLGPSGANAGIMSFSSLTIKNGASTLVDFWNSGRTNAQTYSYHSGPTINVANNNNVGGAAVRVTTTGTQDSALLLNHTYYYYPQSAGFAQLCTSTENQQGGGAVNLNNDSTGVQTLTAYPYIPPNTSIFGADSSGKWQYIQGNGSIATDSTIRVSHDKYYIRQTTAVLPYDLRNVSPTSSASTTYVTNGTGPVFQDTGAGGARPDIGVLPAWHVRHLFTQASVDEINVRVSALVGASQYAVNIRNKSANGTIPCANNGHNGGGGTYTGMMAPNPTLSQPAAGSSIGTTADNQHIPNFPYYAFLITGEPQYLDSMYEWADYMVLTGYPVNSTATINTSNYVLAGDASNPGGRNIFVSGTRYYGCCFNSASNRADAWRFRNMGCAAGWPHPECSGYQSYMSDLVSATADMAVAAIALAPTAYAANNGLWLNQNTADYVEPWEQGYWIGSGLLVYNLTANANLLTAVTKTINWWDHVAQTVTAYCCIGGEQVVICPGNGATPALITSDALLGCIGPEVVWTSGSANFTLSMLNSSTIPWAPAIGDKIFFTRAGPSQHNLPIPGAFTAFTPYYILSVSGSGGTRTVTLTATVSIPFGGAGGGTAISNTDSWVQNPSTGGNGTTVYFQPGSPPAGGCYSEANDPEGFLANMYGNFKSARAAGVTISTAGYNDVAGRWSGSYAPQPVWATTTSYAYLA